MNKGQDASTQPSSEYLTRSVGWRPRADCFLFPVWKPVLINTKRRQTVWREKQRIQIGAQLLLQGRSAAPGYWLG